MPNYDYRCSSCGHSWSELFKIDDRDTPLKKPCAKCKKKKIERDILGFPGIASDSQLTPDTKTDGQWSKLMDKIKKGKPKDSQKKLEATKHHTGRRWKG